MNPKVDVASGNGAVRERLQDLFRGSWAVTALALAVERGLLARLTPARSAPAAELAEGAGMSPALAASILDVLAANGLVEREDGGYIGSAALTEAMTGPPGRMLQADLRSVLGVQASVVKAARDPAETLEGWRADDAATVEAQGTASYLATLVVTRGVIPRAAPALHATLSERACAFLDVGAGTAGGCIGFCEGYPLMRVVGLEPAELPFAQARARVAAAGMGDRIELRRAGIDDLDDDSVYDAAYVAQMFIPDAPLVAGWPRVLRALKPGATMITVATAAEGAGAAEATSRLRSTIWGGGPRTPAIVTAMLENAGFVEIRAMPSPFGAMTAVTALRPPA